MFVSIVLVKISNLVKFNIKGVGKGNFYGGGEKGVNIRWIIIEFIIVRI